MRDLDVLKQYVNQLGLGESISELERLSLIRAIGDDGNTSLTRYVQGLSVSGLEDVFTNSSYEV